MFASKTKVQQGAGNKVKVKPPASPVGAGAARSKTGGDSAYRSALQRFYDSGDPNDWVKAESLKPR
jgi:hypothetical protein